jgi:hypothetical protein
MDLKVIGKKLLEHDKRFDDHDKQFKAVAKKLLEHDDQFTEMREENANYNNEVLNKLDKIVVAVDRLDQERLFMVHRYDRHETEIQKIKKHVGITD